MIQFFKNSYEEIKYSWKQNKFILICGIIVSLFALFDIVQAGVQNDSSNFFTKIAEGITIGGFVVMAFQLVFDNPKQAKKQEEEMNKVNEEIIKLNDKLSEYSDVLKNIEKNQILMNNSINEKSDKYSKKERISLTFTIFNVEDGSNNR